MSERRAGLLPDAPDAALRDLRPLIVHVVYRFDTGGLENGVVNLLNHLPAGAYRHAVVSLTEVTAFKQRVQRDDVMYVALNKGPGHAIRLFPQLWRLFRRLRPAIVHTRNLAALEAQVPAWAAGVPVRIHGEHGRDVGDLHGHSRKYQWVRRVHSPLVHRYVALSQDLAGYLSQRVGIDGSRIEQIYNGVDVQRFCPPAGSDPAPIAGCPFDPGHWLVGTVGRMQTVKNQTLLAQAFVDALRHAPALRERMRLVMVGDGPLRAEAMTLLQGAGVAHLAWLPGERADVAEVMRGLDCFVLPSLAEGISNTILEAMATGLPVLATGVGGNAELVGHGRSGEIVPSGDAAALAQALVRLADDPAAAAAMGRAGREEVERRFSLQAMEAAYRRLYDGQLAALGTARPARNARQAGQDE